MVAKRKRRTRRTPEAESIYQGIVAVWDAQEQERSNRLRIRRAFHITPEQARDPGAYRAAKTEAEKKGQELWWPQ